MRASGYDAWRRLLFRFDPETAHRLATAALRAAQAVGPARAALERRFAVGDPRLEQRLLGAVFPNPVGLAAGFDKDGVAIRGMAALGFGAIEVGTVTPRPQAGNPRPRLFRLEGEESLRNAMGFNNAGVEALARRLARGGARRPGPRPPLGINVGRNRATPAERAHEDYLETIARLDELCDYFVVNVSSPNTPGLRDLQTAAAIERLIGGGRERTSRPILVKLSPDLEDGAAAELARAAVDAGASGVVLTNTTTDYGLVPGVEPVGGLSGRVLRERSFRMLSAVAPHVAGRAVLVSVGGIDSGAEAYRRIRAGASLVQVYTAVVYRGPGVAASINRELLGLLERDGLGAIGEAVGADLRLSGAVR